MGALDDILSGATGKREELAPSSGPLSALDKLLAGDIDQKPDEPEEQEVSEVEARAEVPVQEEADEFQPELFGPKAPVQDYVQEKVSGPEGFTQEKKQEIADQLGIDVDDIPDPTSGLEDLGKIKDYAKGVKVAYQFADMSMEMGRIGSRMKQGKATDVDHARMDELKEIQKRMQKDMQEAPFVAKSFGQLAPFLVNSAVKGGKGALVGAMIGGTGAAVLGQLGPQAAIPEEAATIPAGTIAGAKIGAMFNSVKDIADIEGGLAYVDMLDMGMDPKKAAIASDVVGLGSGLLEMAQFKMLKRLLPGSDKMASSAVSKAVMKVLRDNAGTKAVAKVAGAAVPEAGVETVQEFWNNVVTTAATEIRSDLDKTDLSPQSKEEYVRRLSEGLVETFATTVTGFGIAALPGVATNMVLGKGKKAQSNGDGIHLVTNREPTNSPSPTDIKGRPSVENLIDGKRPDGTSISKDLNVDQGQAEGQLATNDAMQSLVTEMVADGGMQQTKLKIDANEARIDNMGKFLDDAVLDEDPEGALQIANSIKAEADQLAQNYIQLVELANTKADANNSMLAPDVINEVQVHVKAIQDRANDNVAQQTNAVEALRKRQNQIYIDTLNTDQGLEQELVDASVESQRSTGKVLKTNDKIVTEMKMLKASGAESYFSKTPMQKLVKLKIEASKQTTIDRRNNEPADVIARDNAVNNWLDRMLKGKEEWNIAELDRQGLELAAKRADEAAARVEQTAEVQPAKPRLPAAEVTQRVDQRETEVAQQRTKQEEERIAAAAKLKEQKRLTVQEQRARLRKPVAKPSEEAVARKAKAEEDIAHQKKIEKQLAENADLSQIQDEDLPTMTDARKKKAKGLLKAAAIKGPDGTVYEGKTHLSIIMDNPKLEAQLLAPENRGKPFGRGFVQHSGKFITGEQANKLVGTKLVKSEDLLAELGLDKETIDRIENAAQHEGEIARIEYKDKHPRATEDKLDQVSRSTYEKEIKIQTQDAIDMADTGKALPKAQAKKAKVLAAISKDTKLNKLARRFIRKAGVSVEIVTPDELSTRKNWNEDRLNAFKGYHAAYNPSESKIYMNALSLASKDSDQIVDTLLHEALHATIDKTFRSVNKDVYRKGMRQIQEWWNMSSIYFTSQDMKNAPIRVKTFARAMNIAQTGVDKAQAKLDEGKGSVAELDRALLKYEEALTYPFTSKDVAKFLNNIEAPQGMKTSTIRTLWDALIDNLLKGFGISTRTGTALSELTRIANTIFTLPAPRVVTEKEVRMSNEFDTDFDFGANITQGTVQAWNDELDTQATNALPSVVAANAGEAADVLGYKPDDSTVSFWMKDKVVFIADRIKSKDHFISKWMHEQVAHQGLRNVFGKNDKLFNRFLDQAYTLFSIKEPQLLIDIQKLYDLGKDKGFGLQLTKVEKRLAAEEMIALKSEQMKPVTRKGLLKRMKEFLLKWLPKRFIDVEANRKKLPLSDEEVMTMLSMARENVLTGETRFGTLLDDALQARAPQFPYKGWETLPNFMESDETYKKWALAVHKRAPNLRKWYSQHVETIKENFGPDTDLFNVLLAVTSPQTDVETNVQFAVDTYAYMMGLVDKPGALFPNVLKKRIDSNWQTPDSMLKDLESKNFKVTEFTRALLGDPNATVGDLWMFRLFYGDAAVYNKDAETYSVAQITGLRQKLHDLASQLTEETNEKWTPREAQAALWVYINAKQTGKDITKIATYQSGFNRPSEKYGGKTPLEWLKDAVPNLHEGPLSQEFGLAEVPLAKRSPLEKKLLNQMSKEPGGTTKPVKTLLDAERFIKAQKANSYSRVLTIQKPEELLASIEAGEMEVFISEDGMAGFMVKPDGYMGMLFSNSDKRGIGTNLLAEAIEKGGRHGDAFDPFLPKFYKENIGAVETDRYPFDPQYAADGWETDPNLMNRPDVVEFRLSDEAINLFTSPKTGKVRKALVLQNLGGFTGNYTREVRFSREIYQPLQSTTDIEFSEVDRQFLETANDGQSVTGKIHEWRDQAALNINRLTNQLEQEFLEKFGGRKPRITKLAGSGRKLNTSNTELLQKAMNLYIDSGTGANREKAEAFQQKLEKKRIAKTATVGELERLDVVNRMLNMSQEEIAWADSTVRHYYQEFFKFAQEHNLIDSHVDNYVKRIWKMPEAWKDANIIWNGASTTGFKVKPSSGKQRTLDSIIDGWELGLDLRTDGALQNLQSYANELGYTNANRRFMSYLDSLISEENHGIAIELVEGEKPPAGMVRLEDRGFAMPGMVAYARADVAAEINKLGDKAAHKFWDLPIVKGIRKLNATLKSTILSVSMFHHLAGLRSYVFGVKGTGWQRFRPIKAYREGLRKIDQQVGFENPNYEHLGPIVDLLVREGLTFGRTQDWDGDVMFESAISEYLGKKKSKGSRMALKGWERGRRWKRQWTNGLFGRLFAGLKAQSAAVELTVKIRKMEKKFGRGLTDAEIKAEAQKIARLINADFGGLHLQRMGRNPDAQKVLQLLLLAPDWTESNWRTVTGMVPGLNKAISKVVGDNPAPKGMEAVYRKFWGGIAMRGVLTVLASQYAVLALFGDEEDREEYLKQLQQAVISREEFAKGRWATVDLTPVFKRINAEPPQGKRVVFNILGHFKDILKAMTPVSLAKHKASPAVRTVESFATRTDWKGDRFKTVGELWEGLSDLDPALTVEKGKGPRDPEGYFGAMSQLLAAGAYNFRQSLPIPLSELLTGAGSESSMLASLGRSVGVDVRDVRYRDPNEQMYWDTTQEIKQLENKLSDAKKSKDRRLILDARRDIKAYDDYNRIKARLGFTKARLRPVNTKIRELEVKRDKGKGLTPGEIRRLRKLNERKAEIYSKFAQVLER